MPCTDDGQCAYESAKEIKEMKQRLDNVTRMLCEVLTAIPAAADTNDTVKLWWMHHQEVDRARIRREKDQQERTRQDRISAIELEQVRMAAELKKLKRGR